MADAQEDAPAVGEELEEQPATEESQPAPVEDAAADEPASEAPAEPAPEEPAAEAEENPPETEAETTAEEGAGEAEGEGGEGKPGEEDGLVEGGEATEGEQQAGEGEQAEEPAAADGEGVVEAPAEGGEEVDAVEPVEGAEPAEPAEGDEPAEGAEPVQAAEPGEGGEPAEQTEGGESTEQEEGEEGADKTDAGEEGGETEEKDEGDDKEGDDAEKEDGETPKELADETGAEEGEKPESPVGVGEKLSREPTPEGVSATSLVEAERERPEATTPDRLDEYVEEEDQRLIEEEEERMDEEDEEEEEDEEPQFRREELIEKYHEALAEREQLQQQNYALQHKLAEYFKKKKADERQDYDKNVTDQEQRYLKYMAQLEDLRRQDAHEKENYRAQIEDAKERCQEKKEKVDLERKKFMEFKKQVALNAINSRSGKPIPPRDIEQYMVNEVKKEQEVVIVRLENIKLKNKLKKKEQQLKSKEELAEGLHLIDFEQLKIENQTYNEKIEERNEELLKLRKKITSTVQVLTHLKEKLQFVQGENLEQNNELKEVEASLAQSRDILSRTKQARDALRIDNQKLRQNCGLLGNEPLLRDFEERKDEGDDLKSKLEQLRMKHAELTLHCNQVRRKIDQARQTAA